MSTLGKVLLVCVFLASLGFVYLAARALKTQEVHRELHRDWAAALAQRDEQIRIVKGEAFEANPSANVQEGLIQISRKLNVLLDSHSPGRVWRECAFSARDRGSLTVQVDEPAPHGIVDKSVLYVFEQQPKGADFADGIHRDNRPLVFLGEFKVTGVNAKAVTLTPTRRLTNAQTQALANSPGPFALYEQLPVDSRTVWQEVKRTRADKLARFFDGALVTPDVIKEFQRDGDAPVEGDLDERILVELKFKKDYAQLTADQQAKLLAMGFKNGVVLRSPAADEAVKDPQGKVVTVDINKVIQKDAIAYFMQGLPDGKEGPAKYLTSEGIAEEQKRIYVRPLRDYGLIFRQVLAELPVMENRMEDLKTNVAAKDEERAKLDADNKIQKDQQKLLMDEKARLESERATAQYVEKDLADELSQVQGQIAKFEAENKRLALLLKQTQLAEADRINREAREKVSDKGSGTQP